MEEVPEEEEVLAEAFSSPTCLVICDLIEGVLLLHHRRVVEVLKASTWLE